jgi:hypothetical protein
MPVSSSSSTLSETAASLGLCAVVASWLLGGGPVDGPVALAALAVLCVRLLAAAAADLMAAASIPGDDIEDLPPLTVHKNHVDTPPVDAAAVSYTALATTPIPPGTRPPTSALITTVADKLDANLSVFDFIPLKYHAGIRLNKRYKAGNVDVTKWFQTAIDFVGQNGGPGQNPLVAGVMNIPAGRFYVSNIKLAHGITLRGQAIQSTMICPVPGTKGSWLKNYTTGPPSGHGNAGKISIERIRFGGGGEPGITAAIDLEGGDGGWGDYSDLRDIQLSGFPNAIGIKLQVNVSVMYNVSTARQMIFKALQ